MRRWRRKKHFTTAKTAMLAGGIALAVLVAVGVLFPFPSGGELDGTWVMQDYEEGGGWGDAPPVYVFAGTTYEYIRVRHIFSHHDYGNDVDKVKKRIREVRDDIQRGKNEEFLGAKIHEDYWIVYYSKTLTGTFTVADDQITFITNTGIMKTGMVNRPRPFSRTADTITIGENSYTRK